MTDFLYSIPNYLLFSLLLGITTTTAIIAMFITRKCMPLSRQQLYRDNNVTGYLGDIIGVIYAVLIGFTTMYVFQNFSKADASALREAKIVTTIYYDSQSFAQPTRSAIQKEIKNYLVTVIEDEWSSMAAGKPLSTKGDLIIEKLLTLLRQHPPIQSRNNDNNIQELSISEGYKDIKELHNARAERIFMSDAALRKDVWFTIILGSILLVAYNLGFGMNFRLHMALAIIISTMMAAMLFLILSLDRPFRGDFSVKPDAFQAALLEISHRSSQHV